MRISTLSIAIGAASIRVWEMAGVDNLDCMAAHDSKWCQSAQGLFAADEATIDILQRVRYTVRDFLAQVSFWK